MCDRNLWNTIMTDKWIFTTSRMGTQQPSKKATRQCIGSICLVLKLVKAQDISDILSQLFDM